MYWTRRAWAATSAAVFVGILALSWWMFVRPAAPLPFAQGPTATVHPVTDVMVFGAGGVRLTQRHWISALVIVPSRLPSWAHKELASRYAPHGHSLEQVIWNGRSSLFHAALQWNIPGLYLTKVQEATARSGVSDTMLAAITEGRKDSRPLQWDGRGFAGPKGSIHTTVSDTLMVQLASLLPAGGSLVAVNGSGGLLAQTGSPLGRQISWQPHPVGQALTPVMLAMALNDPHLYQGLPATGGSRLLEELGSRWHTAGIAGALKKLGWDAQETVPGQPVGNPSLPRISTAVMAQGRDLWGTEDEVARAYLPFITGGRVLPIHWLATPVHGTSGHYPPVTQPGTVRQIDAVVPSEVVGGIVFHVWRPDSNFAVAYTSFHQGMVLVLEGLATAETLTAIQRAAVWLAHP